MQIAIWSRRNHQGIHLEAFTTRGKVWPGGSAGGLLVADEHKRIDQAPLDSRASGIIITAGAAPVCRQWGLSRLEEISRYSNLTAFLGDDPAVRPSAPSASGVCGVWYEYLMRVPHARSDS